jgi:serine/threonine protein phosphatase PrpC
VCHEFTEEDRFMVLASDGVWEFVKNEEVLEIMSRYRAEEDLEGACDYIMQLSLERWRKEEAECIDDITFVVVFLEPQLFREDE